MAAYPEAGVEVFRVPVGGGAPSVEARKTALRAVPDVRFAGGVLIDPSTNEPVLYTENLFVKFIDTADRTPAARCSARMVLTIKQEVSYATNAFFVEAAEGTGRKVFDMAQQLLQRDDVEYCHPELIRPRARKTIFPQQWHLKKTTIGGVTVDAHANVEAAHEVTRGEGVTIAVIDDGVDIDHPEFAGAGKIVAPRDATLRTDNPRPKDLFGTGPDNGDNHGTACAGVATGNGARGASGVAPAARLMPIRLASGLGSQREADAFIWAAEHGADVISCSWGPADGRWWKPNDPKHQRCAFAGQHAARHRPVTTTGRGGKGCVVLFAAGNGNESVDNDGYASYAEGDRRRGLQRHREAQCLQRLRQCRVVRLPEQRLEYAPLNQPRPLTTGIWTVDRSGTAGYNTGTNADGDAEGMFTDSFGGTSSACPGAAGVARWCCR